MGSLKVSSGPVNHSACRTATNGKTPQARIRVSVRPAAADMKGASFLNMADTTHGSSTTRENILRLARKLPAAPHIFGRLGLLLGNMNADLDNIVRLVAVDSGLTGRVIRMSNSVFYRGDEPVRSLDEAVNRVGFREMHRMVGVAMSEQLFQGGLPVYNLSAEEMWENSVVTALAMENIAGAVGEDEGEAYTLGLLRPVGKLVLDMLLEVEQPGVSCPDSDTLDLPKWERAWAAITSNEAAAMILEEWKMPEPMYDGILHHYEHDGMGGRMAAQLHAACWITHQLGKGLKAEARQWELTAAVLTRAGVTDEVVQACLKQTEEALETLKHRLKAA
jgi:HD-like signal output (HDOD) protein